jgi:hypothetical protein
MYNPRVDHEWIQLGTLVVAALSLAVAGAALFYLIRYAGYTREIAEANFKPAIIAIIQALSQHHHAYANVGNGAALDLDWTITDTKKHGQISCIEAGKESEPLNVDLHALEHRAVMSGANKVSIRCSYRGISGRKYRSVNEYDFERWSIQYCVRRISLF